MPQHARRSIGLRQFRNASCYSYLIWEKKSRSAVIVDPGVELMTDYRSFLAENGLKLVAAVDTQLHPDHLSATHFFRDEYGVQVCMSSQSASARVDRKLQDGELIAFGDSSLKVFSTPGEAPDGISLFSEGLLLTGHLLPLGGRSPYFSQVKAAVLIQSYSRLLEMPGETLVFPARDSSDLLFSTLANERAQNPILTSAEADLIAILRDQEDMTKARSVADIESCLHFNRERSPAKVPMLDPGECAAVDALLPSISAAKFSKKITKRESGAVLIDVREPSEFQTGRISGSVNMPVWDLPFRLQELSRYQKVYVTSLSGTRGDWRGPAAARTLSYVGLPDVIALEGGVRGWMQMGYPIEG